MGKLKVVTVFGTRPEAIKMAPLVIELGKNANIESFVCVTAQHREMLDQVLDKFGITPDFDLNIMQQSQTLEHITTKALLGLGEIFEKVNPNIVLVHGDTTTTFAGSLAAFYKKICVGHVEAGLRTFNKYYPYPEEMNRRLTGVLSDYHFAATPLNRQNLLNEGVCKDKIYVTGNTVIDTFKYTIKEDYVFSDSTLNNLDYKGKRVITVTAHRRENLGKPLENICKALKFIADAYKDVHIVYLVHLNPAVRKTAWEILSEHERISLLDPVDVEQTHNLMKKSYLIITDSGGLQEEAPSLGKPVIVTRNETERQEAVDAGTVKLAGTNKKRIIELTSMLLEDPVEYNRMAKAVNPYGDGHASERIVKALLYEFGYSREKPEEFGK
jgi:UDP-N-acetylglucosamine 2-epimerase (non-hydrolysing)